MGASPALRMARDTFPWLTGGGFATLWRAPDNAYVNSTYARLRNYVLLPSRLQAPHYHLCRYLCRCCPCAPWPEPLLPSLPSSPPSHTLAGGPDDWWSIHEGSCGYGYLDQSSVSIRDVAQPSSC